MTLPNIGTHPRGVDMTTTLQREIRSNERDWVLEASENSVLPLDVSAGGTITLTAIQQYGNGLIRLTGSPAGAFTIDVLDGDRKLRFENASGQTATIDTVTGAAAPVSIVDEISKVIQVRGTDLTETGRVSVPDGALFADGRVSPTGDFNWADFELARPRFKDVGLTRTTPSSSSGTLTLDLTLGNVFEVTLTEAVTTLTISNPPAVFGSFTLLALQDGTGTWVITWPGTVKWEQTSGLSPDQTLDANAVDIYTFMTPDGGTTWYGFVTGLDFK